MRGPTKVASLLRFLCVIDLLAEAKDPGPSSAVELPGRHNTPDDSLNRNDNFSADNARKDLSDTTSTEPVQSEEATQNGDHDGGNRAANKTNIVIEFGNQKFLTPHNRFERLFESIQSNSAKSARRSISFRDNNQLSRSGEVNAEAVSSSTLQSLPSRSKQDDSAFFRQGLYVSVTPNSLGNLAMPLSKVSFTTGKVILETMRFLAPMVIARKTLLILGDVACDYMRGRYFRTTYTRMERLYLRYYEAPAAFRALARCSSQFLIFYLLQQIMSLLAGKYHPLHGWENQWMSFIGATVWILSVVGLGHAIALYVARWVGPLQIQAVQSPGSSSASKKKRSQKKTFFLSRLLIWMQNPQKLLRVVLLDHSHAPESVHHVVDHRSRSVHGREVELQLANPLAFPMTWGPLRLLQFGALAKILLVKQLHGASNLDDMEASGMPSIAVAAIMRQLLLQVALGDEWCRVFLSERRLGLGIVVAVLYLMSLVRLVYLAAAYLIQHSYAAPSSLTVTEWFPDKGGQILSFVCLLPSVFAAIFTLWMNFVIFYNIKTENRNGGTLHGRIRRVLKTLTPKPPI